MNTWTDNWSIEFHSGIPVYKQIIHHIQAAIADGHLRQDEQLPTIRALHGKLGVNPNTVARAYRELEVLGIIQAQRGSGCFVAPPGATPKPSSRSTEAKAAELGARFASEARSHGIPLSKIIQQLKQRSAHV
jgi:GntR family transcriptional regulator